MKIFSANSLRACLTLTIALLIGYAGAGWSAETLKVTGSLWTPYIDGDLPEGGLAADLVRTALKSAGYRIEARIETWPRAYEGTSIDLYDVVAAVWRTAEREEDLLFSEPYLYNDVVLVTRPGVLIEYRTLEDLVGKRIGVVRDYAYEEAFDSHPGLTRVTNNQLIQNLLLLRQRKLDLVISDRWAAQYQISEYLPNDMDGFLLVPKSVGRRALRIGVSRLNPDAADIIANFDAAIVALKEDGRYAQIILKHTAGLVELPQSH